MLKLINWVHGLLGDFDTYDQRRREAYLAEATDLYDLEFRMRKLDAAHRGSPFQSGYSAYQD